MQRLNTFSTRKASKASTRIGGPLRKKPKLQAEDPHRSSKAGIMSGGGCKDANRCSPYMFYHGEDLEYNEIADPNAHLKEEKKPKKAKKAKTPQPDDPGEKPDGDEGHPEDPRVALKEGWNSPTFKQPLANLAKLDDYDDEFTGGAVLTMIRELRTKREHLRNRKFNDVFSKPIPENLTLVQQHLQAEVRNVDGVEPLIKKLDLVALCKDTYGFECDHVIEAMCKELDRNGTGFIPYSRLLDLIVKYVATNPFKEETIEACFRVFDVDRRGSLNFRRMRKMKAAKKGDLYGTSGSNFAMIKALLDLWNTSGDPTLTTTLTRQAFAGFVEVTEALVHGFLEEVFRHILVKEFRHQRERLLLHPDPPTLYKCISGDVSGYDRAVLSAIPDDAIFIPGMPFIPVNTGMPM